MVALLTPRRSFYLSTHPQTGLLACLVFFLLSTHPLSLVLPLHTPPDEPLGLSGVLSAVHTPLVAHFTSPHTQTSQKARLVFFLLSTQPSFALTLHTPLVARFTSPHTQTSLLARLVFFLLSTHPSSLVLPLHNTPRQSKKFVWCSFCSPHNRHSPYLSTHPSSLVLPLHTPRRASWLVWCSI